MPRTGHKAGNNKDDKFRVADKDESYPFAARIRDAGIVTS
jgi:hypothetical protein